MQIRLCSSCENHDVIEIRIYPTMEVVSNIDYDPEPDTWQLGLCVTCSTKLTEIRQRLKKPSRRIKFVKI